MVVLVWELGWVVEWDRGHALVEKGHCYLIRLGSGIWEEVPKSGFWID
jgi:hypothetical protein